jgi:hypothetical protein
MKVEITTANIRNKVVKIDDVETIKDALIQYVNSLKSLKMFTLSDNAWNELGAAILEDSISEASVVELINCACKNALYKITKVTTQVF